MNTKLGKSAHVLVTPPCLIGVSPDPSGSSRSRQGHPGPVRVIPAHSGSYRSRQAHPCPIRLIPAHSGSYRSHQGHPGTPRPAPGTSGSSQPSQALPGLSSLKRHPRKSAHTPPVPAGSLGFVPPPSGSPPKVGQKKKPGAVLRGINWGSPGGKGSVGSRARDRQGLLSDLRVRKVPAAVLLSCKNAKKKNFASALGNSFSQTLFGKGLSLRICHFSSSRARRTFLEPLQRNQIGRSDQQIR